MVYRVEIVECLSPGPESDDGMPSYFLKDTYATEADADKAGQAHNRERGRKIGEWFYRVIEVP